MPRNPSIRDRLESEAWHHFPETARRIADRAQRHRQRRALCWEDRILLIVSALLMFALILRVEAVHADEDAFWGIEFSIGEQSLQSVALDTEISAEITGLVARIDVTQRFHNTGSDWAEAVYRFPLPEGAAVDRLRVEAGGRILEGEIRERKEAQQEYAKALAEGKVASLVEQQRANQFQTRLANIAAGETIRVSISFLAHVEFRDGVFALQIPMTFTPRWMPRESATGRPHHLVNDEMSNGHYLEMDILLRPGMELSQLESRYHDIDIQPEPDGFRLFLADPDTRSDRVFELNWSPDYGATPESTLMSWDGGDAEYALLLLVPPLAEAIEPQAREVVFVIDTSGSMEGASIEQARLALAQGLTNLGPDDRFNLVEFNSDTRALFDESLPAMPWQLEKAVDFISGLDANGGTNMAPALQLAMALPEQTGLLRQLVFITDGSVGNERELLVQIGEQLGDSRLFTVSIGSAPNDWFMRKAAEVGRGSHTRVGQLDEVAERMAALWARIENPAVQDICVDWGMEAEFYPELIPDLYAGEPLWLYARLPREPKDVIVCGELEGRYWETRSRLLPETGGESIATLWARSKVEALEDGRLFGADADLVREQVVDLALAFGLLTRYTSLIAVDRTPVRAANQQIETRDVPNLLPAGSDFVAGFTQTATGWKTQLALSLLSLLVVLAMLLHKPPSDRRARPKAPARSEPAPSTGR
jgi:Ca-activated chloride channel family protein